MKTNAYVRVQRGITWLNLDLTELTAAELVQWAHDQKAGGRDGWSWTVMLALMLKYAPDGMSSAELQRELEESTRAFGGPVRVKE